MHSDYIHSTCCCKFVILGALYMYVKMVMYSLSLPLRLYNNMHINIVAGKQICQV